jgi:hypothetical protein
MTRPHARSPHRGAPQHRTGDTCTWWGPRRDAAKPHVAHGTRPRPLPAAPAGSRVDYALNVQDNDRPRQEALVAHLGVRPQLWGQLAAVEGPQAWGPVAWAPLPTQMWTPLSPPPWDRKVHNDLKQRQKDAVEGAQARAAEEEAARHAAAGGQAGYRQPSHSTPATTRSAAKRRSEEGS